MLEQAFTNWWMLILAAFLAVEAVAIRNKKSGDTLSEHVWKFLGVNGWKIPSHPWLRRGVFGAFFVWLLPHLFLGWW